MIESPPEAVKLMVLRVQKKDSAYLYQVLESYEGLANYSTLTVEKERPYRDIALHIAPDLRPEVEALVERLREEISLEILSKD
jgi:hypothetical protein